MMGKGWAQARRARRDPLGLRKAMADRLLVGLVAAMALLACLALAGQDSARMLAARWERGAQAAVTVQVPEPSQARLDRALDVLRAQPGVAGANVLEPERLRDLLRPWIGDTPGLVLPGVIEVRLRDLSIDPVLIGDRVAAAVPGAVTEAHGIWVARIATFAMVLQGVSLTILAMVAGVGAAVIAVATRAGIAARREAILVLHSLGATDGDISRRIAARAAQLAGVGGILGALLALPAIAGLAAIAAPITGSQILGVEHLPWAQLGGVPVATWLIGRVTAEASVRSWLRRLP